MYKVFVNDHPIILTDENNFSTEFKCSKFKSENVFKILTKLFNNEIKGFCFKCDNLEDDWQHFCANFKIVKAAGGKVLNVKKEVLFIKRFGRWDLPKGKLEKGENIKACALREVEEECGVSKLRILNRLETTYHIYREKNQNVLKITYWFLMQTEFEGKLIPQTEEEITTVVFKNEFETKEALENTYENIKLLF